MNFILSALIFIASAFATVVATPIIPAVPDVQVGDTLGSVVPLAPANFETSLASPISSSATTMTLVANAVRGGSTFAGYSCFTIDEGSAQAEYVCGTISDTTVSDMTRGIDPLTGTTSVSALKFAHRRGASVKITDAPILSMIARILRGEDTAVFTPDSDYDLVNKTYVDQLALGSTTVAASETDDGIVEMATQVEMSSSTVSGSTGSLLALQARYATSSCQVVGRYVPITDPLTGKIDAGCLDTTYASSSLTIGSTPILDIGKNVWATTTGSSTGSFTVPTGISKIKIKVWGAGGGAPGSSDTDAVAAADQLRDNGSSGNYSEATVSVTAGDIFNITVGSGGLGGTASGVYGKQGNPTTIVDNAGAGNFSMTVGDSGDNSGRTYSSESTITGTDKLSGFTVTGNGAAGGSYAVPNNASDQTGGTGNHAVVVIEY